MTTPGKLHLEVFIRCLHILVTELCRAELKTAWIAKEKEEEGIRQTLLAKKEKDIEGGKSH